MKIDSSKYEVYLNYFSRIHDYMVRIINRDGYKLLCNYVIKSNHLSSKKSRIKEKPFTDKEFTKIKSDIEAKLLLIDLAG